MNEPTYPGDEYFWSSFDEAFAALEANPSPDLEGVKVWQCTRDDSYEGVSVLGEGDSWCVMDESGEWMLAKGIGWVNIA